MSGARAGLRLTATAGNPNATPPTIPPMASRCRAGRRRSSAKGCWQDSRRQMISTRSSRPACPGNSRAVCTDEQYWQLTAYLAGANGLYTSDVSLDPTNAADVRLWPNSAPNSDVTPPAEVNPDPVRQNLRWVAGIVVGVSLLVGACVVLVWRQRRRMRQKTSAIKTYGIRPRCRPRISATLRSNRELSSSSSA